MKLNFSREGYDGTIFSNFYVAKGTEGPGWFIYGRDTKKYGTFDDGRGRYILLCGFVRWGKTRNYNGKVRIGWRTKKDAQAMLSAYLDDHPQIRAMEPA